jgi:hypothetical protein
MSTKGNTPTWLLALGQDPPPPAIELDGEPYRLESIFKHDFFALTALYSGARDRVVLKIGRRAPFFGVPLSWIGRIHAWHESAVFREVGELEIVPRFRGRFQRHGLIHDYVEGHELERGEHVPDDFFDRLRSGLAEMHRRGMAYVDLEKPENVLVGDDGRPYLFDFQISFRWPFRRGKDLPPFSWIRRLLQGGDLYHVDKLQRQCRPDQMTEEQFAASKRRPLPVRVYSAATRPVILLRRSILNRIDPVKKRGERGGVRHAPRT